MSGADQSPPRRRDRSRSPPRRRSPSPSQRWRDDDRRDSGSRGSDRGGRGGRPPPRGGDWTCSGCRGNNFERRTSCYRCGAPKPAAPEVDLPWGVAGGPDAPPPPDPGPPVKKEEPNFGVSGRLTEALLPEKNGIKIKWMEPQEAAKPRKRWRLFPFKGQQALDPIPIYRKSYYLLGRDLLVADIPTEHPSCSKQHAVIQHRIVETPQGKRVRPYIIDLGSKNGTFLLSKRTGKKVRLEDSRYYELQEKDVISFGDSTREYVVLNDEMTETGKKADSDVEAPLPKFV